MLIAIVFTLLLLSMVSQADEAPAGDQLAVAGFTHNEAVRLGERMYRGSILANGEIMQAIVVGDIPMDGRMFTCVTCHQRSGQGSVEGPIITWPTGANNLYVPRRRTGAWNVDKAGQGPGAVERWSLPSQYQAADARPAYTDESLAHMFRTGIDPAGNKLMNIMPRYQLDEDDMAVLIHYLKNLSAQADPGVDDEVIRFATVITEGVKETDRDAMLAVLRQHIDAHNTQTRPHSRRAASGPFYKTEKWGAYRKLELDVWELKGPRETWGRQLQDYYQAKPVFALLGGIGAGSWMPVHQFCEDNEIPNIFPVTERPVVSDSDWYTLYFSKGLYQEGEAAARFLLNKDETNSTVIQVYEAGSKGEEIARGFEKTWLESGGVTGAGSSRQGGNQLINKIINTVDDFSLQWLRDNTSAQPVSVLLWLDNPVAKQVLQSKLFNDSLDQSVFLSTSLLSGDVSIIPGHMRESVFLTHPHSLPEDYDRKSVVLKRWLKIRGIEVSNLDIQAKMYFLGWMLPGAIQNMRSEFYRDYFLEGFDMMIDQNYAVAVYPRLSFGPGQRYAAKGCFIVQLTGDDMTELKMVGDWVIN
jgi:hypothetical protein